MSDDIRQEIEKIKKHIKHGKLKIKRKKIKDQVLKDIKPKDKERDDICKKARKKAHTIVADTKRDMSNEVRKHLNTLSEGYDFIEESCGTGYPEFTFYEEPKKSEAVSESFGAVNNDFHTIGVAEGVFAPIGVMSRNNRIYDEDHYDYILSDERLLNKIQNRGMLGTIGHYDKRVDDEDLAQGKVSHIVTDLRIVEEADGTRNLYGKLEIMNTPAGNLLKTYYEHGIPLYVSSRGAGKLLNVPNEDYKRVDKNNYFLETFDIVKDPGFLQAKPNYVKEGLEETTEELKEDNTIHQGDNNMAKKTVPAIEAEMDAQELINKLLNPLKEQIADLTETVKQLSEKVLDVEEVAEEVSENAEEVAEAEVKKETEDDESEKKAEVAESVEAEVAESKEEVVEEKCEDKEDDKKEEDEAEEKCDESKEEIVEEAEVKKETEDDESEKKADVAESKEEVVEEKCEDKKEDDEEKAEECDKCDEAKKDEEAEKLEADAKVDDAKADKLEKDAEKDEEEIEEAKAEDKEELEADKKEDEAKAEELKADAKEDEEDAEEIKEEATEEVVEEKCEDKEDKEDDKKEDEEPVEESIDYEAKYKETEATMNELVKMVSEASERCKATVEKYEAVCKELNAYKLSEELSITIDEAKEKLETKSYDEIKEEASQKVEEVVEEVKEEVAEEPVAESKKSIKPVFSRFASLTESKKSGKKGFSIFG